PLGKLRNFTVHEGARFEWAAASNSYFNRELTPGGVLYDIGVHLVDLLLWWLGEPVSFSYRDDAMGSIEVNCEMELTYKEDVSGSVRLSRDWETANRYTFFFERGTVIQEVSKANRLGVSLNGMPFVLTGELNAVASKTFGRFG